MDEYERAAEELKNLLKSIAQESFVKIVDPEYQRPGLQINSNNHESCDTCWIWLCKLL